MKLNIKEDLKIYLEYNIHKPNDCLHGPQEWPWHRFMGWSGILKLDYQKPTTGYRVWFYFKRMAIFFDLTFDRRVFDEVHKSFKIVGKSL